MRMDLSTARISVWSKQNREAACLRARQRCPYLQDRHRRCDPCRCRQQSLVRQQFSREKNLGKNDVDSRSRAPPRSLPSLSAGGSVFRAVARRNRLTGCSRKYQESVATTRVMIPNTSRRSEGIVI